MKQTLVPKLKLTLKQGFHQAKAQSLKILTCNNDELRIYLNEQMNQNPYLNYHYQSLSETNIESDSFLAYSREQKSLYEEIMEQVRWSKYHPDPAICEYLLCQLNSNGYFKINYRELLRQSPYPSDLLKRHIAILRTFEPHGLFAFDLKECLKIQCKLSNHKDREIAFQLCDHLEALALSHREEIIEITGLSKDEIDAGYAFIKTLNPKPAANYDQNTIYINPEFRIHVEDGTILIQSLNEDLSITFNAVEEGESEEIREYLKKQKAQAMNIMNSIQKRNTTLLQIMQYICDIQKDFFLQQGSLHHLTLEMIAKNCNLHSSTISRAIANKSFEFENQYYALKEMLVSGGVDDISQKDILLEIKDIIDNENKKRPFSDEKICQILNERGIAIARRTVTKYRENCHIYNSQKRKCKS